MVIPLKPTSEESPTGKFNPLPLPPVANCHLVVTQVTVMIWEYQMIVMVSWDLVVYSLQCVFLSWIFL